MKGNRRTLLLISLIIILSALLTVSISDRLFFTKLKLEAGELVQYTEQSGFELPFYLYKDAWSAYQANVLNLYLETEQIEPDVFYLKFTLYPKYNYQLDSLYLEFKINGFAPALSMKDPASHADNPHAYIRQDSDSSVAITFDKLQVATGKPVELDFWVDTSIIDTPLHQELFYIQFSAHQDSVLKLINHESYYIELHLDIP